MLKLWLKMSWQKFQKKNYTIRFINLPCTIYKLFLTVFYIRATKKYEDVRTFFNKSTPLWLGLWGMFLASNSLLNSRWRAHLVYFRRKNFFPDFFCWWQPSTPQLGPKRRLVGPCNPKGRLQGCILGVQQPKLKKKIFWT